MTNKLPGTELPSTRNKDPSDFDVIKEMTERMGFKIMSLSSDLKD
jgi:hypothetical protein